MYIPLKKEGYVERIHKGFTSEQVKFLLKGYCEGTLERPTIEEVLEINRSRFFELLSKYRRDHDGFSIAYQRVTPSRLPLRGLPVSSGRR